MLELERAVKYYPSAEEKIYAVDAVSLTVHSREFTAIFGPSGSGKTTLLQLAAGLRRADFGRVLFEGRDLATLPKPEALSYRRTKLGFVFQNFNLLDGLSAEENVAIPLLLRGVPRRQALERARRGLADLGLLHRAGHSPDMLSGGEQQRVAVARALIGDPKLILADEPTGNLDSDTGDNVLDLLSTLPRKRGAALVLVTHDTRVASRADRVLMMRDGRLTPDDQRERQAAIAT
jgi:putative ABC transport system ATP-binding protein